MTREEAIKILASSCIPGSKQTEALETLIPELRESEDERIRKQLIDAIKIGRSNSGISFTEEAASRYIAWLEKQKEQKELPLMNDDADLYFDTWRQEVPVPTFRQCFEEGMRYAQRLQKEQKPVNHNFTTFHRDVVYCAMCDKNLDEGLRCNLEIVYKIIKDIVDRTPVVKEQKPAEWSEEDEKMLQSIIKDFRAGKVSTIGQEQWLKSLPERFSLQPKQEWSEEDETYLQDAIWCVKQAYKLCKTENDTGTCWSAEKWLKSLKPSWKSSEEQMKALYNVINPCDYVDKKALESLYEQLKKLRS